MADDRFTDAVRVMAEAFGGPFKDFMELSGKIVLRKLEERGLKGADPAQLDPILAEQLLRASWIEAAITAFPGADADVIIADLTRILDQAAMEKRRNADGPETAQ